MSEQMLNIVGLSRLNDVAAIVGDRAALESLSTALENALACGSGGVFAFHSDGEGYALAVVLESDMSPVHTSYAGECAPQRSKRETVPLERLANFPAALGKAIQKGLATSPTRPVDLVAALDARRSDGANCMQQVATES